MSTTSEKGPRSRMPNPLPFVPELAEAAAGLHRVVGNGTIPATTVSLVQLRAGQLLGSTYFVVRETRVLRELGESEERITSVVTWRDATCFTDAERVALELGEAVFTANPSGERVPDELYARASEHYDDKELWTLVMVIAHIGFFAPAALIAKPIPGMPPGRNYTD
ncbi:carboxymuconolactone decarboxylase family protein [Amycolatopsis keratiniphila]|uniref:carboxymuconolactone decarboxylase family protein n=1 Tax=Amycolatopsis keratiniphila TaxID=129921 RepID=UPI00087CD972|nr:carboxymuconolactone decarboxylase family protein [Amycolatopsis keratiniphila]OLZ52756.1 alkylhydroperoxidase [Amycolatopsis keratiniphila subsp. nogabecina]SDU09116.1 Alkylhydroperoxidase family enzyme, contains CxxC motif [Amycolatopsis keratiniphila]